MYRKGVSALIVNKNNEFLLVNLTSFKEMYFAILGGGIDGDESLEECVYREIREEIGIEKESFELVGASKESLKVKFKLNKDGKEYEGSERYFFGFNFIGNDNQIRLKDDEVRSYVWVPFSKLKEYLLFDNQLRETSEKVFEIFPHFSNQKF